MPGDSDIERYRAQVQALKAEAKTFGVYITSDVLADVKRTVDQIRRARDGKPACYWRAYERNARECQICEVRSDCSRGDDTPEDGQTLSVVPCEKCSAGTLSVALVDPASGAIRDYGCTGADCTQTLSEQTRHRPPPGPLRPKVEVRKTARTLEDVEIELIDRIKENPGCSISELVQLSTASATRSRKALDGLRARGAVQAERVGRQIRLWIERKEGEC